MDADTSALRSGRRWRRRPPPPPQEPKPPEAQGVDAEAPGSPSPGGGAGGATLFSCGVCRETAGDPVVTACGHLFCWPCLYRRVRRRRRPLGGCPVCKSAVAVEPGDAAGVTPIYGIAGGHAGGGGVGGRGGGGDGDRALEVPPRPRGLQDTSDGGEEFREELRILSRDVDTLEIRMWRVMASVAELRLAVLVAYVAEIERRNGAAGASSVAAAATRRTRRRRRGGGVLGTQSNGDDGGGDGVYRGTRSRRRQANL